MLTEVFSCEDAAQQVLMYVCVSVDKVENVPQNVPECMQNVTKSYRMHTECASMHA